MALELVGILRDIPRVITRQVRISRRAKRYRMLAEEAERRAEELDALLEEVGCALMRASPRLTAARRDTSFEAGFGWHENGDMSAVCWDAPVGIIFYVDAAPAFVLGGELEGSVFTIRQLQGVVCAEIPKELRRWPRLIIRGTLQWARDRGIGEVRVVRAHATTYYHQPDIPFRSAETWNIEHDALKRRLRRRYDWTARQEHGTRHDDYYSWRIDPA